jgi:MATE family multidrug resistance protein
MSIRSLPYKKDSDLVDEAQEDVLRNRQDDEPDNGGVNMTFPPTLVNKDDDSFHLSHEAYKLLYVSLPSVAVQLSVRTVFPQTASVIGRTLGTRELAAFSLASLTANLTCQSIIMGALTAAETLMPRAYGQERYREVGLLAIRGLIVSTVLLLPPIVFLCTGMEWLFQRLGQDPEASKLASEWIRIYLIAIPSFLMFRVVQAFLNAQHVVLPLVFGSFVACIVIHPILLKLIVPLLGLTGSGLCIAITQFGMISWVMLYLKVRPEHHSQSWPGFSQDAVIEALQPGPLCVFVTLSLGGVLSLSVSYVHDAGTHLVMLV